MKSTLKHSEMTNQPITPKYKTSLGIRSRLIIGFFSITFIFLLSMGITYIEVQSAKNISARTVNVDLATYDTLADLSTEVYQAQIAVDRMLLSGLSNYKDQFNLSWENVSKTESLVDGLAKSWTNSAMLKAWPELKMVLLQLKSLQLKIVTASSGPEKAAALKLLNEDVIPLIKKFDDLFNTLSIDTEAGQPTALLDMQLQQLQMGANSILNSLNTIQTTGWIISVAGVIVSILIALLTARGILRHVNIFRQHSKRIASGDLTRSISVKSHDEMGQLGNDLNIMTKSLANIAKEITQSCHNMVSSLEEVRHAVDTQSSGAAEQSSSINEITASLSEIEKSSSQTMEKAKVLGEVAERTREKGQLGLEAVDQSSNGMKEVREKVQLIAQTILDLSNQTQQVGEITAVVNNLAQQSKMLALNASIEAAKAGEAGKGFAVVAVEVKNLAEQSEQATTQVQKILEDIRHAAEKAVMVTEEGTKGVDHGMGLVEQTGDTIRDLTDVIHETTIASQQIESAVRQEGAGIEQITVGMNEINKVTSTFVESVKQTTEALGNLAAIAKNLKAYIDVYKL